MSKHADTRAKISTLFEQIEDLREQHLLDLLEDCPPLHFPWKWTDSSADFVEVTDGSTVLSMTASGWTMIDPVSSSEDSKHRIAPGVLDAMRAQLASEAQP